MKRLRLILLSVLSICLLTNVLPTNSLLGWQFIDRASKVSAHPFFLPDDGKVLGLRVPGSNADIVRWTTTEVEEIFASDPLTGLRSGEKLTSMAIKRTGEFRTELFGTGNLGGIYLINAETREATLIETVPSSITNASNSNQSVGMSTNPLTGFLAISNTEAGSNIKVNPSTGSITNGQNYFYAASDINAGKIPKITGLAFGNNFPGATTTKLFGIDSQQNTLVEIADNGECKTIGSLGVNPSDIVGFSIAPKNNETELDKAFATFVLEGETLSKFYSINLQTGRATEIGKIGDGTIKFAAIIIPNPLQQSVATCDIVQSVVKEPLGGEHSLIVKVFLNGQPVANATVNIAITDGPNKNLGGTSRTDTGGEADFNYMSNGQKGIDTIVCSGSVQGSLFSCTTMIEWTDAPLISAVEVHAGESAKDIIVSGFFKRDDMVEINGAAANKVKYKKCDNNGNCSTLLVKKGDKFLLVCPAGTPVQNQLKVFRNPGGAAPPLQDTQAFATCP